MPGMNKTTSGQAAPDPQRVSITTVLAGDCACGQPHLFNLVELAHFRTEDMHDHITGIDQNPVTCILALDLAANAEFMLQLVCQLCRQQAWR